LGSELKWVGFLDAFIQLGNYPHPPFQLGIEKPRIYPGVPDIDANDLVNVWGAACWLRCEIRRLNPRIQERLVYPHEWKRQVRKAVHHHRIWQHLTTAERALFPLDTFDRIKRGCETGKYSSAVHNHLDSAGIGLFLECRTGRAGRTIHYG
jgi:hypothetical protein